MSRRLIGLAMLAVATLATSAGCNRKPHLIPAGADSTGAVDSSVVMVRELQSLWEQDGSREEAVALTARVLWKRFQSRPSTEWKEITEGLLDSLGIGYETAAGACGLVVNFFARSDPGAGSWPYLFTCGKERPLYQAIEGRNLRLMQFITRGLAGPGQITSRPQAGAAVLFGRRAGGGQQPVLMVWQLKQGKLWDLVQTLGPDSLGGTGTGEFETPSDTTIELVTRTYRTPPFFEECATCPHLYKIHRFRWVRTEFARSAPAVVVPSPYATFVQFIQALVTDDYEVAERLVTDRGLIGRARKLDWGKPQGIWRVAPVTSESPHQIVFFRGDKEAYRVEFVPSGDGWLIAGIEETTRTVE